MFSWRFSFALRQQKWGNGTSKVGFEYQTVTAIPHAAKESIVFMGPNTF